jgi:hypothetical protein
VVEMRGAVCCFVRRWLVVTCLQSKRHVRPFELSLQANEAEITGPRDVVSRTPPHESRQELICVHTHSHTDIDPAHLLEATKHN